MTAPQMDVGFLSGLRDAMAQQLPAYLLRQRWFGAKARKIESVELADCVPMPLAHGRALIALVRVDYAEDRDETYVVPLLHAADAAPTGASGEILRISGHGSSSEIVLTDALASQEFLAALLAGVRGNLSYAGERGTLQAWRTSALEKILSAAAVPLAGRVLKAEQSNTSIVYGEHLILKFYRRVEEGVNPDLDMGRFLTEVAHFPNTPPLGGWLEYSTREGKSMTLGILQGFVRNQGDAWRLTLESLKHFLAAAVSDLRQRAGASRMDLLSALSAGDLPADLARELATQAARTGLLGKRTAELHVALAGASSDADFAAEPFTAAFRESLESSLHDLTVRNFNLLRSKSEELPASLRSSVMAALNLEEDVLLTFHTALEKEIRAARTRIHGDYHLGQVLYTGSDFVLIDFEGEPARPVSERRAKRSPLQDVAGMLRSFHYAVRSASLAVGEEVGDPAPFAAALQSIAVLWQSTVSERFLKEYKKATQGASFLPADPAEFKALLRMHLLEKAIYELGYELNNRPAWLAIPLGGIEELVGTKG